MLLQFSAQTLQLAASCGAAATLGLEQLTFLLQDGDLLLQDHEPLLLATLQRHLETVQCYTPEGGGSSEGLRTFSPGRRVS